MQGQALPGFRDFYPAELALRNAIFTTDRKSTRLNSSHGYISYAVFCLKKKNTHRLATSSKQLAIPQHTSNSKTLSTSTTSSFLAEVPSGSTNNFRDPVATTPGQRDAFT